MNFTLEVGCFGVWLSTKQYDINRDEFVLFAYRWRWKNKNAGETWTWCRYARSIRWTVYRNGRSKSFRFQKLIASA